MAKPFDSIFKEIFEKVIPDLASLLLNMPWGETVQLKEKTQVTLEREADYLKKLVYRDPSANCIFHGEFHAKDEDLRSWMLLQRGLLRHRYHLPVRQAVFYIGDKKRPRFPNRIDEVNLLTSFDVIVIKKVPFDMLYRSGVPEMVILAILTDFGTQKPEDAIRSILQKLQELVKEEAALKRLVVQLGVLSNLRKLRPLTINAIEAMPISLDIEDIEDDILYKKGLEKGLEKGIEKGMEKGLEKGLEKGMEKAASAFIRNLLNTGHYTPQQIADIGDVPLAIVIKVRREMKKTPAPAPVIRKRKPKPDPNNRNGQKGD